MLAVCLEFLGLALCVTGSLFGMVACGLPTWKVTAFIDSNIVVAQTIMDGLWMSCVVQSTGQMQCKFHDSVLGLPQALQTAGVTEERRDQLRQRGRTALCVCTCLTVCVCRGAACQQARRATAWGPQTSRGPLRAHKL
uniref:Claudin n=1 Tax=Labrus bergylta TaxID=56723 RepID=A0A3Q3E4J3_9LABR